MGARRVKAPAYLKDLAKTLGQFCLRHQGKLPAWGKQDWRPRELCWGGSTASQASGQ